MPYGRDDGQDDQYYEGEAQADSEHRLLRVAALRPLNEILLDQFTLSIMGYINT